MKITPNVELHVCVYIVVTTNKSQEFGIMKTQECHWQVPQGIKAINIGLNRWLSEGTARTV